MFELMLKINTAATRPTFMLYYLFTWLNNNYHLAGAGLFQYITFRAAMAIVLSLVIATVYGKRLINFPPPSPDRWNSTRSWSCPANSKRSELNHGWHHYPFMIIIPTLLFADLDKVYVRLMLLCAVWLEPSVLDDYKLKARKRHRKGWEIS